MNELFGISMTLIMVILLAAFNACLVGFAGVYFANRTMFRMGLRNIRRRRAQSTLIVSGLMLATVIITAAFTTGDVLDYSITKVAYDNLHRTDLSIHHFRPTASTADDASLDQVYAPESATAGLESAFASDADIEGFMPFLFEPAPVLNSRTRLGEPSVILAGFDAAHLERFGGLHLTSGDRAGLASLKADETLIGKRAADKLDARVGDVLTVFIQDQQYQVTVAGIVKDERSAGMLEFGGGETPAIALPLATVQQFTGHPQEINSISVVLRGDERSSMKRSDAAAARLEQFAADESRKAPAGLGGLAFQVEKNKQDAVQAAELLGNVFTTMFIVLGLFSIAAGTALIFTLFVMLATERRQEMGIARAVGAERRHLVQSFLAEGMVYDLLAGLVGTVLGVAAAFVVVVGGVRLLMGDQLSFVSPHVAPRSLVVSFCLGGVLTFLTVVVSALRISRLNIVAAIRGQAGESGREQRRATRWLWVALGVPALVVPPLGLYWLLRKGLGMPWAWVIGPSGLVFGALLMALGEASGLSFPFSLGISLIPLSAGALATYYGAPRRLVWSLAGAALVVYWLEPQDLHERLFGDLTGGMEMFVLSGIFIVAGFTMVIVFNARVLTRVFATRANPSRRYAAPLVLALITAVDFAASFALGDRWRGLGQLGYLVAGFTTIFAVLSLVAIRFPRFSPAVKMAIAYPLASRFRTGMTIGMFSLVIFSITVMGVINQSFLQGFSGDDGRGGWDIIVTTNHNNPIDDLKGALAAEGSFDASQVAAVGKVTAFDDNSQEARPVGDGDWAAFPIIAGDASFFANATTRLEARARGYDSAASVFEDVGGRERLALVDSSILQDQGFGPVDTLHVNVDVENGFFDRFKLDLRDPVTGNTQTVTVIGILSSRIPANVLVGVYVAEPTYRAIYGKPDYSVQYVRLQPGVNDLRAAKQIKAALVYQGVQAVSIQEQIDEAISMSRGFLRIMQVFMGLGLFVGIASLGVIALRSVVERRQQIGMMRAIGYQRGTVALSFILESSFIALTGILSGVVGGAILSYNLLSSQYVSNSSEITFFMPWLEITSYCVLAFAFALLLTWWPSRRAAAVPVAEALRYE